jgi:hypothetical protein
MRIASAERVPERDNPQPTVVVRSFPQDSSTVNCPEMFDEGPPCKQMYN